MAALTEALAIHAEVNCVARSGRPDDPGTSSVTPGSPPAPKVRTLETIIGGKRQVPDAGLFAGKGKVEEIAALAVASGTELAIFKCLAKRKAQDAQRSLGHPVRGRENPSGAPQSAAERFRRIVH